MRPTWRRAVALAAAAALAVSVTPSIPARATSGWLDPSFADGGSVRLPGERGDAVDLTITIGSSGEVVVARSGNGRVEAVVLTSQGSPLQGFGDGGWQAIPRVVGTAYVIGLFATPSGGIVAVRAPHLEAVMELGEVASSASVVRAERAHLPLDRPVAVHVRLPGEALEKEQGLDEAVIRTGRVVLHPEGNFQGNAVRLEGGSIRICYEDVGADERRVFGLTPSFAADRRVGASGHRSVPMRACEAIGADAAGHLYLAGTVDRLAESKLELVRTTTSGELDGSWNGDGRATVARAGLAIDLPTESVAGLAAFSHGASPIAAMPDGSLFMAASVARWPGRAKSAAVIKLTPDGDLDPTFDGDGIRAIGPSGGQSRILAMAVDSQGRPVLSAIFNDEGRRVTRGYLVRLTANGRLDPRFGEGGMIEQVNTASSLAIDAQDRILTAAWAGRTTGVIVARREG